MTYSKLWFYKFKMLVSSSVSGELQLTQILLNFQTSCCKTLCGFSIIFILKGIMTLSQRVHAFCLYCPKEIFFNIWVLSQCIMYGINFQNIYTFTYQKTLLHTFLLLVFKIVESLQSGCQIWPSLMQVYLDFHLLGDMSLMNPNKFL